MNWPALNIYTLTLIEGCLTRVHLHDMGISSQASFSAIREATGMGWIGALGRLKKAVEHQHRQRIMDQQKKMMARKRERKGSDSAEPKDG